MRNGYLRDMTENETLIAVNNQYGHIKKMLPNSLTICVIETTNIGKKRRNCAKGRQDEQRRESEIQDKDKWFKLGEEKIFQIRRRRRKCYHVGKYHICY